MNIFISVGSNIPYRKRKSIGPINDIVPKVNIMIADTKDPVIIIYPGAWIYA